ncbi:hypothetical protein C8R44DRAFT_929182 [Mycena epipterygia]|nr:hypothetical protein C8R44DRAFT_929182 [Mycena epipterygia]
MAPNECIYDVVYIQGKEFGGSTKESYANDIIKWRLSVKQRFLNHAAANTQLPNGLLAPAVSQQCRRFLNHAAGNMQLPNGLPAPAVSAAPSQTHPHYIFSQDTNKMNTCEHLHSPRIKVPPYKPGTPVCGTAGTASCRTHMIGLPSLAPISMRDSNEDFEIFFFFYLSDDCVTSLISGCVEVFFNAFITIFVIMKSLVRTLPYCTGVNVGNVTHNGTLKIVA